MSSLFIVLGILFVLSFVPLAFLLVRGYLRFRGVREVSCPETGRNVKIRLDATHAALSSLSETPALSVASCERWPEKKDCNQACVDESEPLPRPAAISAGT
jgi:hypothetical protein